MAQQSEVHTGVTGEVQIIDDTVASLINAGEIEKARAAYEKIQTLSQGLGSKLQTVSAPSVIIKPGKTERRIIAPEEALDLTQGRVFGADKMEKAFGHKPVQIPDITGSTQEFRNAARLDQQLRLRAPLTMLDIHGQVEVVNAQKSQGDRRKALYSIDWYKNEDFARIQKPQAHWALTSGEPVNGTFGRNCLEQTDDLIIHLHASFQDMPTMAKEYAEALAEYKQMRPKIEPLMYTDRWSEASLLWSQLKIVQLLFGKPAEILSDINVDQGNGGSLLRGAYTRTSAHSSDGCVVRVGYADPAGASVFRWYPDSRYDSLGASFSRRLS